MTLYSCPLCPRAFQSDEGLYSHVVQHNEHVKPIVTLQHNSMSIIVVKPHSNSVNYKCPLGSCKSEGALGAIAIHYITDHAPPKRKRLQDIEEALNPKVPKTSYSSTTVSARSSSSSLVSPSRSSPILGKALSSDSSSSTPSSTSPPMMLSSPELPHRFIDYPKITATHTSEVFAFIANAMSNRVLGCAYHTIMLGVPGEDHNIVEFCSKVEMRAEYVSFKEMVNSTSGTVCYGCLCPQTQEFGHTSGSPCTRDTDRVRDIWKDWWRVLVYLVFRTKAIREVVFGGLGIKEDRFGSLEEYASWLPLPAQAPSISRDSHITNIIMVAYIYFLKVHRNELVFPERGFLIDTDSPAEPPS